MPRAVLVPVFLAGLLTIGVDGAAFAQPILEPNYLEFSASPDHAVSAAHGPLVTRYDLLLYVAGSAAVQRSLDLGKPVPDASGTIRLSLRSLLNPLPADGKAYEVRVAAVGPGGTASSAASQPFAFGSYPAAPPPTPPLSQEPPVTAPAPAPCSYTVAPLIPPVRRAGGRILVAVTAPAGCTWAASEGTSWLSIASGSRGSGNGTVSVTVAAYSGTASRTAIATIAGQRVRFSQSGRPPAPPGGFRVMPR